MKFISALLLTTSLLATNIPEDLGPCLPNYSRCVYGNSKAIRVCEGARWKEYTCPGDNGKCVSRGSAYYSYARCE